MDEKANKGWVRRLKSLGSDDVEAFVDEYIEPLIDQIKELEIDFRNMRDERNTPFQPRVFLYLGFQ